MFWKVKVISLYLTPNICLGFFMNFQQNHGYNYFVHVLAEVQNNYAFQKVIITK